MGCGREAIRRRYAYNAVLKLILEQIPIDFTHSLRA
jgi:hypothetical protein